MLLDGASCVCFQGKMISMLEYLTPHDLDFQIVDIDLSKLNQKKVDSEKPVMVFDRAPAKIKFSQTKSSLPPIEVDTVEVSKEIEKYLSNWLKRDSPSVQNGNHIMVKLSRNIRSVARPSINWAQYIKYINEERNLFKAVSLYAMEYLFKTRAGGYFLALSGGSDSTLSALFVYFACQGLAYFAYQPANQEIIDKISYIIGLPIFLKKVDLSEQDARKNYFLSYDQITKHSNGFALTAEVGKISKGDQFQYCLGDDVIITSDSLSSKILNVAYLPMDFSGITKPFMEKLKKELGCNSVEFSIQGVFDAFKGETEKMLVK